MIDMNDRELLELAAKAGGIEGEYGYAHDDYYYNGNAEGIITEDGCVWNPLTCDGDALRLAVKLEMMVHVETCYYATVCKNDVSITEHIGNDGKGCIFSATRRAIVKAAAQIGKRMK